MTIPVTYQVGDFNGLPDKERFTSTVSFLKLTFN